jgi:hypothetical protein
MRVASICDTCATYINAQCIIYNGDYLSSIDVSPLDSLDDILGNIDGAYAAQSGVGSPTSQIPAYIGQDYIDTNGYLWKGLSTTIPNWGLVGALGTTTTTTSTSSTTTTTTTAP